jgi:putative FmdB family regulatory protein
MPLYEYECANGHRFEIIQRFSDSPVEVCPTCGSPVRKLLSSPAIQFKGSGWYITDYARKDQGSAARSEEGKTDSKTDTKGADARTGETDAGKSGSTGSSGGGESKSSETKSTGSSSKNGPTSKPDSSSKSST